MITQFARFRIDGAELIHEGERRPLAGAHASIELAGTVKKEVSAKRVALTGGIGLAWRKTVDDRHLVLEIAGVGFSWTVRLEPDTETDARAFVHAVNAAAAALAPMPTSVPIVPLASIESPALEEGEWLPPLPSGPPLTLPPTAETSPTPAHSDDKELEVVTETAHLERQIATAMVAQAGHEKSAPPPSAPPAPPASTGETLREVLPHRLEAGLAGLLLPSETVHVKLKGAFKEGLICTDRRVVILKGGFMTGQMLGTNSFQQPYSNISGVQVQFHLLSGYFELSAGGMQNTPKSYWSGGRRTDPSKAPNCVGINSRGQAERFRAACSFILTKIDEVRAPQSAAFVGVPTVAAPQDHVLASLEKLGQLRDAGVLTDEEFQIKKTELLQRL